MSACVCCILGGKAVEEGTWERVDIRRMKQRKEREKEEKRGWNGEQCLRETQRDEV